MNNYLIVIVGPTAIGKTDLSIELAKHFNSEILSADSRQFYKEMGIGTAVPSKEELSSASHHFIQHRSIKDVYNVGDFESEAIEKLNSIFNNSDIAILVGGSGLYVDAVVKGLDEFPEIKPKIREQLNLKYQREGIEALANDLNELDPETYSKIDLKNPHRVIRALEVSISSGKPFSSFLNQPSKTRNFKTIKIGLIAERAILYDRINHRVDVMMEEGLLEEVRALEEFKNFNALNTVGYKELFKYFDGEHTFDFAISEIKKNTRRFAKRQLTWFSKDDEIKWFDHKDATINIISYIESIIKKE